MVCKVAAGLTMAIYLLIMLVDNNILVGYILPI
jgi:hypothetical protein